MVQVQVQLFAHLRAAHSADTLKVELPDKVTAEVILSAVGVAAPDLASRLAGVRVALDDRFLSGSAVISQDSRIALIPPVSGG